MMADLSQTAQLTAAVMSAIAAIAAAVATWRGPLAAAKLAERLRSESEAHTDARRFKLNVFATLMQERAEIYSADAVRAFNSLDIAFAESSPVREAWAELYQALSNHPLPPGHVTDERLRKLLREIATDLNLSNLMRMDDLGRVYFPSALQKERQVQQLQRDASLK